MKRKGSVHRTSVSVVLLILTGIWTIFPLCAQAHIYRYIDANGVVSFTNAPATEGVVLFLREPENSPKFNVRPVPKMYEHIIKKAGQVYGVETALIKAVIKAESDFDPFAVSRKGARGLMQIMPETGRDLDIGNLFDPSQNIMGGTKYLSRLLDRYKKKLSLALAAYNAGPFIVDRYRRIPPIKETREYVEKVMLWYERYKRS